MSKTLDVRGRTIATYVAYQVEEALRPLPDGEVVELRADEDAAVDHGLRAWCAETGHELLAAEHADHGVRYQVEKHTAPPPARRRRMALVVSDPGLEELLSPLGFALAAALEGMEVSVFFQGPAVRVLTRGFTPRLKGWGRPFSRFARRGLERAGHVHPREKLDELRRLGARLYVCGPSMSHFRVREQDLVYDDVVVAEYLTFLPVMKEADVPLYI